MTPEKLREKLNDAKDLKIWAECCGRDDCEECCNPDFIYEKDIDDIELGTIVTITGVIHGSKSIGDVIADDIVFWIKDEWPDTQDHLHGNWIFEPDPEFDYEILRAAAREMVEKAIPKVERIITTFEIDAPTLQALREIMNERSK